MRGRLAAALAITCLGAAACGGGGDSEDSGNRVKVGSGDASRADREKGASADIPGALSSAGIDARKAGSLVLCGGRRAPLIALPGKDAERAWEIARDIVPRSGRWPVLLGDDEAVAGVRETLKVNCGDSDPDAELRKAERLDPKRIVADRTGEVGIKRDDLEVDGPLEDPPPGSVTGYTIPTDVSTGKPLPQVWMTLLPTKHSWHAPALLMFGDFNDCPPPAVHAAMHRYWERKFGSEIVGINMDTIETHAPGVTLQGASPVPVAREQFAYAPDVVWQGTDDLATLASILSVSDKWYFWWD